MTKRVAILGSTGSVGRITLRVIEALGQEYKVVGLSAHRQIGLLARQIQDTGARVVAVTGPGMAARFRQLVDGQKMEVLAGPEGLVEMVQRQDLDIIVCALVGIAGLPAVLAAARAGKRLAIANKEPLVVAGQLLTSIAQAHGSAILPVDSEHSAIFQAMQAGSRDQVNKIILTGSGGPFRHATAKDLQKVTRTQALSHPVWQMGPKITIDSATMMNKALEIIEAQWMFGIGAERIEVLIHPESIVHSLVEFIDGSVIAQLGRPDMALPIQYALTYPRRVPGLSGQMRLEQLRTLTFEQPDTKTFRALDLAYKVARTAGTACAVFNAANEAAVEAFLADRIRFSQIIELVEECLINHSPVTNNVELDQLIQADQWARRFVKERLGRATKAVSIGKEYRIDG